MRIPRHIDNITPFLAVEVFQAASLLEAKGRSIVHLEFGEPDLPTPSIIKEAAIKAMLDGHTRYTHSLGIPRLREVIAHHHQVKYGVQVHPDQIVVSMGSSVLMQMLMLLLLEKGDQVILADPSYACYANFVRMAGGEPVFVKIREKDGFQLDPAAVKKKIGKRTKALLICSPANPTGVVMKREVLKTLAGLGVPLISDEIYHGLTYSGEEHTALEFSNQAFVLNGFSKYFAMTGWRLGYLIFPRKLQPTIMKMHQNIMISAADYVQHAGIAAITKAIPECEVYKAEYDRRRVYMIECLQEIGLPLKYEPVGAFYCFADASRYGKDSIKLAMDILNRAGVAVTPGLDFGAGGEGCLRFSYANSLENIAEGMQRLGDYLKKKSGKQGKFSK
ncbi:MAG: pyridoxal phosphate-dependent aminotransferase [SAR324 cluster bacterium]|nr:pyridoxal phosphate-dependent aminotransferase [SAR324 cluster bacterium]